MQMTVRAVYDWLDAAAPFETAEGFDNVGLLLGRMDAPVTRVLLALDATPDVAREARALGAELIVTHHPLFFHGRKELVEDDAEANVICELIRHNISLIAAHTNLDKSPYSGSDAMACALGLRDVRAGDFLRVGALSAPMTAREVQSLARGALGAPVRLYGEPGARIDTLAVAGGAFDEGFPEAMAMGAQALLTGEVRHHNAVAAAGLGFALLEGGHFATEAILISRLRECLQNALHALQYKADVFASRRLPYGGAQE